MIVIIILCLNSERIFETRLEGGVNGWETKSHDYRALGSLRVNDSEECVDVMSDFYQLFVQYTLFSEL